MVEPGEVRQTALFNRNAVAYYLSCEEQGVSPEAQDLYDQGLLELGTPKTFHSPSDFVSRAKSLMSGAPGSYSLHTGVRVTGEGSRNAVQDQRLYRRRAVLQRAGNDLLLYEDRADLIHDDREDGRFSPSGLEREFLEELSEELSGHLTPEVSEAA